MISIAGLLFGAIGWFLLRYVVFGFFTVNQNETRGEDVVRPRGRG